MSAFSPKLPPGVRRLFRLPQSRGRLLHEMDEEVAAHLAMRAEELRALGMSADAAEAEARRRFGDAAEFRDYAARRAGRRARWLGAARWLAEGAHDVRVASRGLRRAPALAAVVVLTLAVCIGATTGAYGVVRHLLLAPLPYADGNRIVHLTAWRADEGEFRFMGGISSALLRLWAARARTLEEFAAYDWRQASVGGRATRRSSPSSPRRSSPCSAFAPRWGAGSAPTTRAAAPRPWR